MNLHDLDRNIKLHERLDRAYDMVESLREKADVQSPNMDGMPHGTDVADKVGNIAGCMVLDGKVNRQTKIRLIRDGIVVHQGTLGSLKRFKDDVKEVSAGFECGLNIENFNDIKVGDIIEGYTEKEVSRKL